MASRTYSTTLELTGIDDLFRAPDLSPLDSRFGDHSRVAALDFVADEIYSNGSYRTAAVTFVVPAGTETDLPTVKAGIARWASARAREHQQSVAAARWRGTRSLMSAAVLFVVLVAVSQLAEDDGTGLGATLAKGLEVASWVVLWFPIDLLLWSVWQHRLDRRSYAVVRDMDVTIRTAVA